MRIQWSIDRIDFSNKWQAMHSGVKVFLKLHSIYRKIVNVLVSTTSQLELPAFLIRASKMVKIW